MDSEGGLKQFLALSKTSILMGHYNPLYQLIHNYNHGMKKTTQSLVKRFLSFLHTVFYNSNGMTC